MDYPTNWWFRVRNIQQWCSDIHDWALRKGFWKKDEDRNLMEQAVLFHSEITEFVEDIRAGRFIQDKWYEGAKPCGPLSELADLVIRVFDTCGAYGLDLEGMIKEKMAYNETRPHKHGKEF